MELLLVCKNVLLNITLCKKYQNDYNIYKKIKLEIYYNKTEIILKF